MRLVDDDDPLVHMQDVELERKLRLGPQVTVEVHERVGTVDLVTVPGASVVVDETPVGEHRVDVDLCGQLVAQEVTHRCPRHRVRGVAIRRAHPRGAQPVTHGQRGVRWHGG